MLTATHPGTRGRLGLLLALLAALALAFVAGCGGGDDDQPAGAAGASPSGAAGFVPASAPIYIELSTDVDGPQWTQVFALADRFPSLQGLRAKLARAGGDGIVFERDIKPLLGKRAGLAVLALPAGGLPGSAPATTGPDALEPPDSGSGDPRFLAVVELAEGKEDAARAAIAREAGAPVGSHEGVDIYALDDDAFLGITDGAILVATRRDDLTGAIDAHEAGGDSVLSGVDRYQDTLAKLPADTFIQAYVDVGRIGTDLAAAIPQLSQAGDLGIPEEATLAVSLAAEDQGLRLKGVLTGVPGADQAAEFTPALTARVPGDALLYVGLKDLAGQAGRLIEQIRGAAGPEAEQQIQMVVAQLPALLGVSLDDLTALASLEHALVVTPGTAVPGISLILEQEDGARASRTLDSLRTSIPALLARFGGGADLPPWRPAALENGVSGWELPLSDEAGVVYGVDGDLALIGSSVEGLRRIQKPVPPLSENPAFVAATSAMPEEVTSIAWVDIEGAVRLADALGAFDEGDESVLANLRPLKSLAAWSTVDGDVSTFEALLTIQTP